MKQILFAASVCLLLTTTLAQAQTSAYVWDENEGGLLDLETGLVWGFGPSNIPEGGSYTYQYAMDHAGEDYVDLGWGFGFNDWRVPTKAELLDAVDKDVYLELSYQAAAEGLPQPYVNGYWAADPPFKQRGLWYGYHVRLDNGEVTSVSVNLKNEFAGSVGRAIVVRETSGN